MQHVGLLGKWRAIHFRDTIAGPRCGKPLGPGSCAHEPHGHSLSDAEERRKSQIRKSRPIAKGACLAFLLFYISIIALLRRQIRISDKAVSGGADPLGVMLQDLQTIDVALQKAVDPADHFLRRIRKEVQQPSLYNAAQRAHKERDAIRIQVELQPLGHFFQFLAENPLQVGPEKALERVVA